MKRFSITTLDLMEMRLISGDGVLESISKSIIKAVDKLGLIYCVSQDARRLIQRRDVGTIANVGICLVVTGVCSGAIGDMFRVISDFFSTPESGQRGDL